MRQMAPRENHIWKHFVLKPYKLYPPWDLKTLDNLNVQNGIKLFNEWVSEMILNIHWKCIQVNSNALKWGINQMAP